ncbi:hypothetical protein [Caballeronia sp. M23-90]
MTDDIKDINHRNSEFWAERAKRTDELLKHLPTAKMAFAEYLIHAEDTKFEDQKPFDFSVDHAHKMITRHVDALRSVVNSSNAKAPRPRKNVTHRTVVVLAMGREKKEGKKLKEFVIAAEVGRPKGKKSSIDGVELYWSEDAYGNEKYRIRCDEVDADDIERTFGGLQDWWKNAHKS